MSRQIGEWLVGEPIADGGMGVVYEARHSRVPGEFAVKELRPEFTSDAKARAYFLREATHAIQLNHPNIVRTFEKVEVGDRLLLVMERLYGDTLESFLTRAHQWDADSAVEIIRQIAAGLGYAHARSIVHRDVKPSNVLIQRDGRVKVLDFGISRTMGEASLQSTGSGPPGTPMYMPPEILMGAKAVPASDVFSLGLIFFRMVTGEFPHVVSADQSPPWAVIASLVKAYAEDLPRMSSRRPDVPRELDLLTARMLSLDPLLRPQDGGEVVAAFDSQLRGAEQASAAGASKPEAPPWGDPSPSSSPRPVRSGASAVGARVGARGSQQHHPARASGRPRLEPAVGQAAARLEADFDDSRRTQLLLWGLAAAVLVLSVSVVILLRGVSFSSAPKVPATEGWIEVNSKPTGASIELHYSGRTQLGRTPQTFRGLLTPRGVEPATVWIRSPGYEDRKFVVPVVPGLEQHINAQLKDSSASSAE